MISSRANFITDKFYLNLVYVHLEDKCRQIAMGRASPNSRYILGDTPLHVACSVSSYRFIENILIFKPNLNLRNDSGSTPLVVFIDKEPREEAILVKLLEAGADPNIPSKDGYSPLHVLASQVETNIMEKFARLLVQYKANVDARNKYQETPLHLAVHQGKESLVEVLLESGASINITDSRERTAMDRALEEGYRYPRILTRLSQHLIILHCTGFSVHSGNLEEVCNIKKFSNFKRSCEEEIRLLKVTFAGNSTVTYFKILVSSTKIVSRYLFNTDIVTSLSQLDIGQTIFGPILMKKFEAASKHHHALKRGIAAAEKFLPLLTNVCIEELMKYLDFKDFINLDKACSLQT